MAAIKPLHVRDLGDYIRDQRHGAQISLRQLARLAGVSNPYLSQIERGLRKPSAEILQQIAKALRISAEALYVQAGILDERLADSGVPASVLGDAMISERQKQVLLEIYESFRKENEPRAPAELDGEPADGEPAAGRRADTQVPVEPPVPGPGAPAKGAATRATKRPPKPRTSTAKPPGPTEPA